MPTKDYFIPYAGSTAEDGPGIEVSASSHGVAIRRSDYTHDRVFLEPGQVARLAEVLTEIAAERRAEIDQAHADEHAVGQL